MATVRSPDLLARVPLLTLMIEMTSLEAEVYATVPEYYSAVQRQRFKDIIDEDLYGSFADRLLWAGRPVDSTLIDRHEACITGYETDEEFLEEGNNFVMCCHMEEDITVRTTPEPNQLLVCHSPFN